MQAAFSADDQVIIDALGDAVHRLAVDRKVIEERRLDRETLLSVGRALSRDGWFDVALTGAPDSVPFSVLTGMAERAGLRLEPFSYPLVETWAAIYALSAYSASETGPALARQLLGNKAIITLATDAVTWSEDGRRVMAGWVPYGALTDVVVVPTADSLLCFHSPSITVTGVAPELDLTSPAATLELAGGVSVPLAPGGGQLFQAALRCLQAGALVGQAQALLDQTIAYVKQRHQFGVPIGSFQAIKHRLADLFVELESARSLAYYAAWVVDQGADHVAGTAAMSKGFCADMAARVAREAIQLHGGIGFTWEGIVHFGARRIAQLSMAAGTADECHAAVGSVALEHGHRWTL